tara:strand:+ start:51 stop:524 length:474 start_codon:yes stop_codon:yes gene_type:complete
MVIMVTVADVEDAQHAWGEGIVAIATAHSTGGDYVEVARNHVETLYAYGLTAVLFKPTLAVIEQFRPTFDSALSYFVASNNVCPEDKGFAIKGWTKVRFENTDIIVQETTALAMGNYYFTSPDGDEVKVEYTFGYIVDPSGNLRIQLHHSSMPATND